MNEGGEHILDQQLARPPRVRSSESPADAPLQFDPQKRAASLALRSVIKRLTLDLETAESRLALRTRRRKDDDRAKFQLAVEAIACNFLALMLSGPSSPLAVPRDANVMWAAKRYRSDVYGSHFLAALDLMTHPEVGLAVVITRGFKLASGRRQQTTMRPTPAFASAIGSDRFTWSDLHRTEDPEVLVLHAAKDRKTGIALAIDYPETALTRRLRKEVQLVNRYLQAAPVILLPAMAPLTPGAIPTDPTRKTVRRIFNNGSWMQGGRLFDGFWETMPRQERMERLRISTLQNPEGERVVNVDFGQLFPSLAYAQCDVPRPDADLYDIRGDGSHRDGFKKLLNAMLFATKPLTHWPTDTSAEFPSGTKLKAVIAEIAQHHAPIAHLFGLGIGFRLMAMESGILISAVLRLFVQGFTALPLHDSVLVAASQEKAVGEAMQAAYGEYVRAGRAKLSSIKG